MRRSSDLALVLRYEYGGLDSHVVRGDLNRLLAIDSLCQLSKAPADSECGGFSPRCLTELFRGSRRVTGELSTSSTPAVMPEGENFMSYEKKYPFAPSEVDNRDSIYRRAVQHTGL